jgi:hypothetical protein
MAPPEPGPPRELGMVPSTSSFEGWASGARHHASTNSPPSDSAAAAKPHNGWTSGRSPEGDIRGTLGHSGLFSFRVVGRAFSLEPREAILANRAQRVINDFGQIRAVSEHEPGVGPIVAKDAPQALSMESKTARPSRNVTSRERLEPGLRDRPLEARAPTAFPLLGSWVTLRVALQLRRGFARDPRPRGSGKRRMACSQPRPRCSR